TFLDATNEFLGHVLRINVIAVRKPSFCCGFFYSFQQTISEEPQHVAHLLPASESLCRKTPQSIPWSWPLSQETLQNPSQSSCRVSKYRFNIQVTHQWEHVSSFSYC